MRRLETKIREEKEAQYAEKQSNVTTKDSATNIKGFLERYDKIADKTGIEPEYTRTKGISPNTAEKLTNSGKSSIINTKIINGRVTDPMPKPLYNELSQKLRNSGIKVIEANGDDLLFLKSIEAEASYGNGYIMHQGEIPSASAMYEEIVHAAQAKIYGEIGIADGDLYIERAARECAAQDYMLSHSVEFSFTEQDIEDIRINKEKWMKDYKKRTGIEYDFGTSNRGILDNLWSYFGNQTD